VNDSKAMQLVVCPCCKGEKYLLVYDATLNHIQKTLCCHCMGKGWVMAEISDAH
jgi:uncharacterized protein YbaR (Trm112 family)